MKGECKSQITCPTCPDWCPLSPPRPGAISICVYNLTLSDVTRDIKNTKGQRHFPLAIDFLLFFCHSTTVGFNMENIAQVMILGWWLTAMLRFRGQRDHHPWGCWSAKTAYDSELQSYCPGSAPSSSTAGLTVPIAVHLWNGFRHIRKGLSSTWPWELILLRHKSGMAHGEAGIQ